VSYRNSSTAAPECQGQLIPTGRQRRWFSLGRGLWLIIVFLSLGLFFIGAPGRFEQLVNTVDKRSLLDLGLSASAYAVYVLGLNFIVILAHTIIAVVIFWHKPNDWMALFVSFTLIVNGALIPLSLMSRTASIPAWWSYLAALVIYSGLVSSIIILYIFPNGRFTPRWTRLLTIMWVVLVFFALFLPHSALSFSTWPLLVQIAILLFWSGTGVFAQIYRFEKVSSPLQRQQIKWALLGLMAATLGPFAYFLPFVIFPAISTPAIPNILYQRVGASFFAVSLMVQLTGLTIVTFTLLLFPLLFAIAILRHRLWDIDILIRRTLIYGILTAALALVYFGTVVLLQKFLQTVTHEGGSAFATVVSTLVIATLFNPLRWRVQDFIDRRFYRRKYNTEQTLIALSTTLRDKVDLDELTEALVAVVKETMQPAHVSLWLCSSQHKHMSFEDNQDV
jgi:hypothetical protein